MPIDQSRFNVVETKRNVRINGVYLHHRTDPEAAARRWIKGMKYVPHSLFVVFGCGVGYEVRELLARMQPHDKIIIVEPLDAVIELFVRRNPDLAKYKIRRVRDWNQFRNIYLSIGDWEYLVYVALTAYRDQLFPEMYKDLVEKIEREMNNLRIDSATTQYFAFKWQENVLRNLRHMAKCGNAAKAIDRFRGLPVIIVSAGPSLQQSLPLLKKAKGKALIMASQTTNRVFETRRVKPDLIFSFDGDYPNYTQHFKNVSLKVPLVFDPALYWRCLDEWKGPLSMMLVHPANHWLETLLEDSFKIAEAGPSIACTMLDFAKRLGADPVIFIGQDLSYTGGRFHLAGTHVSEDWDSGIPPERQICKVRALDGSTVLSDVNMLSFLHWFEETIPRYYSELRIINATAAGAEIRGMKHMDFEAALKKHCRKDRSARIKSLIHEITRPVKTFHHINLFMEEARDHLEDLQAKLGQAVQLTEHLIHDYDRLRDEEPDKLKLILRRLGDITNTVADNEKWLQSIHYLIRPVLGTIERPIDPDNEELIIAKQSKIMFQGLHEALKLALPLISEQSESKEACND